MRSKDQMRPYQLHGVDHVKENPFCGLFLDMGMGKTCTSLTAIDWMLNEDFCIQRPLIIAPKRVAEDTWSREVDEWEHLKHLRVAKILGPLTKRIAALRQDADIWVINRENVAWLVTYYAGKLPFDCVIIDELSSFKSPKSLRFKALRMIRPQLKRLIGLTGTPAPNGLIDLWSQLYLMDQGERLGKTLTKYRETYFIPGKRNGHIIYEYKLREEAAKDQIMEQISDICISMKSSDYLDLPKRIDRTIRIALDEKEQKLYKSFEKDLFLGIGDEEITAVSALALTGKLRQFSNGFVYDADKKTHIIHDAKLEALAEQVEEAQGEPMLVFYQFQADIPRIKERLKAYRVRTLTSSADIDAWNSREVDILLAHAASAGHGLNLQYGGHLITWFGVDWPLELYLQAVARLDRQGQTKTVINTRLITQDSIEEDILRALVNKKDLNDAVMEAVKVRRSKYLKFKAA
jgi:SNF2 family DNA or RNA helicase